MLFHLLIFASQALLQSKSESVCKSMDSQMMKWRVICKCVLFHLNSIHLSIHIIEREPNAHFRWWCSLFQKYRAHIKRKSTSNSQTVGCWSSQEECKQRNSKSNSPDGPLQLSECNGVDDEDDFESESCSSNIQK